MPEFVAPPMSRCGIRVRSATTGSPVMVLPTTNLSREVSLVNVSDSIISRKYTMLGAGLGTSTPIADLPGIGASILTLLVASASAILSWSPVILLTLIPGGIFSS